MWAGSPQASVSDIGHWHSCGIRPASQEPRIEFLDLGDVLGVPVRAIPSPQRLDQGVEMRGAVVLQPALGAVGGMRRGILALFGLPPVEPFDHAADFPAQAHRFPLRLSGKAYNYIEFGIFSPINQDYINHYEVDEILLDFNVDGEVYDLI